MAKTWKEFPIWSYIPYTIWFLCATLVLLLVFWLPPVELRKPPTFGAPSELKKGKQHCLLDINGGAQKGRRGNQDTANMGR
uniref:Uncharacterized protein n=1 Tax=Candidatus Kentrum sp. TC TaxID=2126339 RepID=A0A450ZVK6_9GAMM|nr:MAG: hypothetical protein BECKTC1821F_GA0114240_102023 [Candidatus Kentron sp. TC]